MLRHAEHCHKLRPNGRAQRFKIVAGNRDWLCQKSVHQSQLLESRECIDNRPERAAVGEYCDALTAPYMRRQEHSSQRARLRCPIAPREALQRVQGAPRKNCECELLRIARRDFVKTTDEGVASQGGRGLQCVTGAV